MKETTYSTLHLELTRKINSWEARQLINGKTVVFYINQNGNISFDASIKGFPYSEALDAISTGMKDVKLCIVCDKRSKVTKIAENTVTFRRVPSRGVSTRIYYSK